MTLTLSFPAVLTAANTDIHQQIQQARHQERRPPQLAPQLAAETPVRMIDVKTVSQVTAHIYLYHISNTVRRKPNLISSQINHHFILNLQNLNNSNLIIKNEINSVRSRLHETHFLCLSCLQVVGGVGASE